MDITYRNAPANEPERQYYFIEEARKLVQKKSEELGRQLTYNVTTFGCQMNARDSEKLRGILDEIGYVGVDSEECDFVLYNTCTVRENANKKVYGRLGYLNTLKKKNPSMMIALCGCMMQEEDVVARIRESYRFVDLVFGTHNIYKFAELFYEALLSDGMVVEILKETDQIVEELPVERKYRFKSGVNIMFGCNNFCSYCIVPYVRGRERSRRPEEIVSEIEGLVSDGVVEVMLLGQNVNSYGKGLEEDVSFAKLLKMVADIEGLKRVRFMTPHPKDFSDDVLEVIADNPKICRHIHLPLQSGSTDILRKMNRHYTKEDYLALVDKIRARIPDIAITTDIIVGFPGETEEDFLETMDVVERVGYDSAFTFIYSKRTGTPAAAMEDQIAEDVIKDRFDRLLKSVQELGAMRATAYSGETVDVLVEEINRQDANMLTGRMSNNSTVHFVGGERLIGQIVKVKLVECKGFYYIGEMVFD